MGLHEGIDANLCLFSLSLPVTNQTLMARKKLSQTQIAFIILLWIALVAYILLYAQITPMTVLSILMSGAIVFIPIYKNLKK